jgi:energy-coupling factor transport system ATP-binding protein
MPITFKDVSHVYSAKTPYEFKALHHLNFSLKEGSFTAIIGQTGSGKSTFIQHMNGLLSPTSGVVTVNGQELLPNKTPKKLKAIRQYAGVVFQFPEYQLFEETVEEDVMFGPINFGKTKAEALVIAHQALTQVGIDASFYKRSPFELSGGERRRVAIAGILAIQPKILILDEPTAGLDPKGTRRMMDLFKKLHEEGMTIVFVTHDMNLMYGYATDVVVFERGTIHVMSDVETIFDNKAMPKMFVKPHLIQLLEVMESFEKPLLKSVRSIDAFVQVYQSQTGEKR